MLKLFIAFGIAVFALEAPSSYIAGLAEHYAVNEGTPEERQQANIDLYASHYTGAVANDVQILVFPEFGTTGGEALQQSRQNVTEYAVILPDDVTSLVLNPCTGEGFNSADQNAWVLHDLSCLARNNTMLSVFDIVSVKYCSENESTELNGDCPDDGFWIYNVAVIFHEDGHLINWYAKKHPALFELFDVIQTKELVTFTSSFGVEFGIMICFDICFQDPGPEIVKQLGVKHILYPVDQSFVGLPLMAMWSWLHEATLLASNLGEFCAVFENGSPLEHTTIEAKGKNKTQVTKVSVK